MKIVSLVSLIKPQAKIVGSRPGFDYLLVIFLQIARKE